MSQNPMITCREALAQLWAFIDGELPEVEARGVKAHLEACKGCHPHFDYQKTFCQFLRRQSRTPVPPSLRRRVFLALLEEDRRAASQSDADTPPESHGPDS